ncbi:AraC family transcriptional regulator [Hahella sp. CCB-MM4]|uniref:AraC family transcriptional regulator n=1 Tax=Hahella sp. (strain CCB-MM4) TaxID=1926491 RepID=UPI000B9AEBAE|nr:AraC family transcriptional regulator [Hahella sp. CCB-MM4]OZG73013.1 AraC family transcriptional regulator [Hahella sp. CCB-MM4]
MANDRTSEKADFGTLDVLDGLEFVRAQYLKQNFARHVHEGYTIGVIDRGAQRFFRTGDNHVAGEDSLILVNADDVHTGESASSGGWAYRAFYPRPEQFAEVCKDLFRDSNGVPYFPEAVVNDPFMAGQLRLLFSHMDSGGSKLLTETILYAVMTGLVLRHSRTRQTPKEVPPAQRALYLVKDFIDSQPAMDISLRELSGLAGLSPYHLVRQFKKQFGLAPHGYQIQARLKLAKNMLKLGHKPAQVAVECGFHDQSHFSLHFKRALGTTPGRYQQQSKILL